MAGTWKQILERSGWPTEALVLDFETYSDKEYELKKLSTIEYVRDARFEFLGLGSRWVDHDTTSFHNGPEGVAAYISTLQKCRGKNLEKCVIVVANAKFDISILYHIFRINPPYVIDIQDLGRTQDSGKMQRLDVMAFDYLGKRKLPDLKTMTGLHWNQLSPTQRIRLKAYTDNDVDLEHDLFKLLLPMLSRPEIELQLARHTLKMYLEPKLRLNFKKANILIQKMEEEIKSAVEVTGHEQKLISSEKFIDLLKQEIPENEIPVKQGKKKVLLAISKTDEGREELLHHPNETVRHLMEARVAVKSWPLHIKKIYRLINQATALHGLIGMPLKYHGAHTGRWSGEENINPQNFGARGNDILKMMKEILEVIYPYELVIGDLSQIEARMVGYMSGQDDLVEAFRSKQDVYSIFATELFQAPVRKPRKTDPPYVGKIFETRRFIGKESILGLGYGMGADKFFSRIKINPDVTKQWPNRSDLFTFADKAVRLYRGKYTNVTRFWNQVEQAFMFVTRYPGESKQLPSADLTFYSYGSTVTIVLPSGRELKYPECRIGADRKLRWKYGPLWGGTLVENIVQAASRDIIAEQLLVIEFLGYPTVLTVHDATISVRHPEKQPNAVQDITDAMCTAPKWCEGIPLGTEIKTSRCYC